MTDSQKELINRLIKAYRNSSTELLIGTVTATDGMIEACRTLLNKRDAGATELKTWLQHRCDQAAIDEHAFLQEIRTIIELFSPHSDDDDPYQVLGLTSEASPEQIKRAYRKLSLQYHPDTASEQNRTEPDQFIKITRAYQTLLGNKTEPIRPIQKRATNNSWRQKKQTARHSPPRKKLFAWSLGLLILLLIVSFFAATNYRKNTMIAGLQQSRGAFVPPTKASAAADNSIPTAEPKTTVSDQEQKPARSVGEPNTSDRFAAVLPLPEPDETPVAESYKSQKTPPAPRAAATTSSPVDSKIEQFNIPVRQQVEAIPSPKKNTDLQSDGQKATIASTSAEVPKTGETEPIAPEVPQVQAPRRSEGEAKPATPKKQASLREPTVVQVGQTEPTEKISSDTEEPQHSDINRIAGLSPGLPVDEPDKVASKIKSLDQRLQSFFDSYLSAYSERNILSFSRFFTTDAVENNKPFATMVQTYLNLFQSTDHASLQLQELDWQETPQGVQVNGRFTVNLHYRDGHQVSGSGPIAFRLQERDSSFLIETLDYHFEH